MRSNSERVIIENKIHYPEIWAKNEELYVKHITVIKLFNFIPLLKIIEKRQRKYVLLFDHIPLFSIKNAIKF